MLYPGSLDNPDATRQSAEAGGKFVIGVVKVVRSKKSDVGEEGGKFICHNGDFDFYYAAIEALLNNNELVQIAGEH